MSEADSRPLRESIPNALTVLRLLLGFAFPFFPQGWWIAVCALAAGTEFFDGFLSRVWGVESDTGKMLDPIADKVFVLSVLITFVVIGRVALYELVLIGVRDLVVGIGCSVLLAVGRRAEVERCGPRPIGKLTTWFQFAFLLAVLVLEGAPDWLFYTTAAISAMAAVDYVVHYARAIRDS